MRREREKEESKNPVKEEAEERDLPSQGELEQKATLCLLISLAVLSTLLDGGLQSHDLLHYVIILLSLWSPNTLPHVQKWPQHQMLIHFFHPFKFQHIIIDLNTEPVKPFFNEHVFFKMTFGVIR